jgi:hypothetical protein
VGWAGIIPNYPCQSTFAKQGRRGVVGGGEGGVTGVVKMGVGVVDERKGLLFVRG